MSSIMARAATAKNKAPPKKNDPKAKSKAKAKATPKKEVSTLLAELETTTTSPKESSASKRRRTDTEDFDDMYAYNFKGCGKSFLHAAVVDGKDLSSRA